MTHNMNRLSGPDHLSRGSSLFSLAVHPHTFAVILLLAAAALSLGLTGCGKEGRDASDDRLYVYNAGEYLDYDVIEMFEEETGIEVVYDEFETNEVMYPKLASDLSQYDVICPSDYMIEKMMQNDMLTPIDHSKIPNAEENIGQEYWDMCSMFDPGNKYAVPHFWGTVGLLYDTTVVEEEPTSWEILWDPKYRDEILMQDSVRDMFVAPLKILGYSLNTTDENELWEATNMLIEQKPLVQAYIGDEVRDKMIAGEAALAVIYSGEAELCLEGNENLDFVIPEEGTEVWIDAWVISAGAKNVDAAHKWIDFMNRPDIALKNFEYIYYSSPNLAIRDLLDEEELDNPVLFPDLSEMENLEALNYLGVDADRLYFDLWKEIKSAY